MYLLNFLLAQVMEEELRGDGNVAVHDGTVLLCVGLQRKIPESDRVVRTRRDERRLVRGVPLDRGNRSTVKVECRNRCRIGTSIPTSTAD